MKRILMLMCAAVMAIAPAAAQRLEIGRGERTTTQTARHSITGVADPDATLTVNGEAAQGSYKNGFISVTVGSGEWDFEVK